MAHRVAYELFVGPLAPGMVIDHLCKNTRCVNPDHLEQVTQATNCRRKKRPTHCVHGHDISWGHPNTYVRPDGNRNCRACQRNRRRAS